MREEGSGESFQELLSSILGVSSVGIRRVKSEISSTQRGLPLVPKRRGFNEDLNEEIS